jgi:hypothetical protein
MFEKRSDMIKYILLAFFVFLSLKIYFESEQFNLKCVISSVDGNKYCVRDREKLKEAVDLIARVVVKCDNFVNYLKNKYPADERIVRLWNKFNPRKISETLPTSTMTAYSENKGEKLAFCLNKRKENNEELIDENTLTYVALHELSHIMTKVVDHKQEFWDNFKFILKDAVETKMWIYVDYSKTPEGFCGMEITDNLLGGN